MSRRVVASLVVTAALLSGCSDSEADDAGADSGTTEPATTEPAADAPTGPQVVLRSEFAGDAAGLQAGAEALRDALAGRGVADAEVSVDGDRLVVGSADPGLTAAVESLVSGAVSLHPVLQCTEDASMAGDDTATEQWLPLASGEQCQVGPLAASGTVFLPNAVPAIIEGGWSVNAELRPGGDGQDVFNSLAASCFDGAASCPSQRLAVVVDGRIVTAPTVNVPSFAAEVQIVGEFPEAEAVAIASTINIAALGLSLEPA